MSKPLEVLYRNHRGEVRARRIRPETPRWGSTPHHPEEQWLLRVWDYDRNDFRDFAMADILGPVPPPYEMDWPPGAVPTTVSREELIGTLEGLIALVRADDSMEGSLMYSWGDEPGQYKIGGAVRVGNSLGQGGMRIFWETGSGS